MALSLTKLKAVQAVLAALNVDLASLVDLSGSMTFGSEKGDRGESRWNVSKKVNTEITRAVCAFDDDGIDLVFFNNRFTAYTGIVEATVRETFDKHSPNNGTVLAPPMQAMINKYLPAKVKTAASSGGIFSKAKPAVYEKMSPAKPFAMLIWTDGSPADRDDVEAVIIDATQRINKDSDFGIAIIQVGHDSGATAWLKTLDEGLEAKGAAFDVVAVVHLDEILAAKLSPEDIVRVAFTG